MSFAGSGKKVIHVDSLMVCLTDALPSLCSSIRAKLDPGAARQSALPASHDTPHSDAIEKYRQVLF